MVILLIEGNFMLEYLPFHLCSTDLFLITLYARRTSKLLGNFLYLDLYPGSPLLWFEERWGNHLLGYPVLLIAVAAVMSVPTRFVRRKRHRGYRG